MPDRNWGCFPSVRKIVDSVRNLYSSAQENDPPQDHLPGMDFRNGVTRYNTVAMKEIMKSGTKIGEGATASVYQGVLDGRNVALKHMNPKNDFVFKKELRLLSSLDNANIVKLLGYCFEGDQESYIVYQMIEKGSLDVLLFAGEEVLTWKQRLDILLGIARGVEYLHQGIDRDMGIIHCDLKPENILLDEDFIAYVSDFGSSEEIEKGDFTLTKVVSEVGGTFGYRDHWNINSGDIGRGTDIYSFGCIIYDMIRGERVDQEELLRELNDVTIDYITEIMDHKFLDDVSIENVREVFLLSCDCRGRQREDRPPIEEVVVRLEGIKSRA